MKVFQGSLHNIFAFHYIDSIESFVTYSRISAYQIYEIANLSSLRFVIPARCRCYQPSSSSDIDSYNLFLYTRSTYSACKIGYTYFTG